METFSALKKAHPNKPSRHKPGQLPKRKTLSQGTFRNRLAAQAAKIQDFTLGLHGISTPYLIYLGRYQQAQAFTSMRNLELGQAAAVMSEMVTVG